MSELGADIVELKEEPAWESEPRTEIPNLFTYELQDL